VAKLNTQPLLDVRRAGTMLSLSWPALPGGFRLQGSSSLINPTWSVVANPVIVTNGRSQVTLSSPGALRYFRLNKP
jgi:hypothetical protein